MNLNQWMATFQSPIQLAKAAHKQIATQHYEIQALKAQVAMLLDGIEDCAVASTKTEACEIACELTEKIRGKGL